MRRQPMTSTQHDPEPEGTPVQLQPMKFHPQQVDDHKAVYKASIEKPEAICTFTVTVARELYETEDLKTFLNEMQAEFVLTKPHVEADIADDRKPQPDLDLEKEIVLELDVQPRDPDGNVGATAVVETPVPKKDDPKAAQFRSAPGHPPVPVRHHARLVVLAGHDVRLDATGGVARTATAAAREGSGTLRSQSALNPHQTLTVGGGNQSVRGKAIWLHASSPRMVVDIWYN
jgi:hypothetical protein